MRALAVALIFGILRLSAFGQATGATTTLGRDVPTDESKFPANWHPFKKHLYAQIGSAWYRNTQTNLDKIAIGTIRIAVTLSPDGKITRLRVLSNTSNALFEQASLAAIRQAHIPPVPPELLTHGQYQDELSFTMYPDDNASKPTKSPVK